MKRQTKFLQLFILGLLLLLALAACQKPTPGAEEAAQATAAAPETILEQPTAVPVPEEPVIEEGEAAAPAEGETATEGGEAAVPAEGETATEGGEAAAPAEGETATEGGEAAAPAEGETATESGGAAPADGETTDPNAGGGIAPTAPAGFVYHTVEANETVYSISQLYGVPMEAIAEANNMENDLIVVGQQLLIPMDTAPSPTAPAQPGNPANPTTIVVAPGQNLFRIGLATGYSAYEIAACNNIPNPHLIFVGQVIKIPPNC